MLKSCYSKWQNHGKLGWILQMVPLPTVWLSKKSPLVRSEMVCAASGAQCKEQPDAGAMGSQDEVECKRQGDLKVMAWWGLVDGRMLEVRWMVDENGRPQLVSGYVTTVCIAGRPLESLVYARWSSILHNQPQHQLSQSQISSKSVLPFDRR